MSGNARFEDIVCLLFEHTEARQVGRGPVLLVERCKVEALVVREGVVSDHLGGEEQMLLLSFPLLGLDLEAFLVEPAF